MARIATYTTDKLECDPAAAKDEEGIHGQIWRPLCHAPVTSCALGRNLEEFFSLPSTQPEVFAATIPAAAVVELEEKMPIDHDK